MSYSRSHYRLLSNGGPDTPALIDARVKLTAAGEQVGRECRERFNPITAANIDQALEWQAARLRELRAAGGF